MPMNLRFPRASVSFGPEPMVESCTSEGKHAPTNSQASTISGSSKLVQELSSFVAYSETREMVALDMIKPNLARKVWWCSSTSRL